MCARRRCLGAVREFRSYDHIRNLCSLYRLIRAPSAPIVTQGAHGTLMPTVPTAQTVPTAPMAPTAPNAPVHWVMHPIHSWRPRLPWLAPHNMTLILSVFWICNVFVEQGWGGVSRVRWVSRVGWSIKGGVSLRLYISIDQNKNMIHKMGLFMEFIPPAAGRQSWGQGIFITTLL